MPTADKTLYLVTLIDQSEQQRDQERLVNATTRNAALKHVVGLNKASPADVARVMAAGGKVEEVAE